MLLAFHCISYIPFASILAGKQNILNFNEGDVIEVLKEGEKWWVGLLNGQKGYIPSPDCSPFLVRK
tara:strand:+ start:164 stop:361 length:198 start_codon:yes stop_codon:yes gene_type:complete